MQVMSWTSDQPSWLEQMRSHVLLVLPANKKGLPSGYTGIRGQNTCACCHAVQRSLASLSLCRL